MRRRAIDRRQCSLDFGARACAIPLAPRRAVDPSPNYHEMAQFVRRVRAAGLEPLQQLLAMVHFAITDTQRLASTLITDADIEHLHPDVARCRPSGR